MAQHQPAKVVDKQRPPELQKHLGQSTDWKTESWKELFKMENGWKIQKVEAYLSKRGKADRYFRAGKTLGRNR